jgi:deoxyinosine 3'endonuclease (endonuclease V)
VGAVSCGVTAGLVWQYVQSLIVKSRNRIQKDIAGRVELEDRHDWSLPGTGSTVPKPLRFVAGLDISFVKGDDVNACAGIVVVELPDLEVSCLGTGW